MHTSDVVVVSAPLTERTTGMIGTEQLRALGPDGVLINVGRGPLVAERPLYEALSARTIAGAAIDVWYQYPDADGNVSPSELPFGKLPNILMTPHSSGVTDEYVRRQSRRYRRQHRAPVTRRAAAERRCAIMPMGGGRGIGTAGAVLRCTGRPPEPAAPGT